MSDVPVVQSDVIQPIFKRNRRRWWYAGAAVVVVLGAGIPLLINQLKATPSVSPSDIYQVRYGAVSETVSATGTLQAPTEIDLNFTGTSGILSSMNVKVGQHVTAGQVLARLNDASAQVQIASAQAGVAQAQGNLAQAQAKLTQTQEGPTSADLAVDQTSVTKAQAALAGAQQQYQDQLKLYNDRTSQEQQVVSAQHALASAEQQAAQAQDTQTVTTDQQNLTTAQQTLSQAQAQYGNITAEQVQQAYQKYQSELDFYNSWQNGGYVGSNPYTTPMQAAQTYYTQLNSAYQALQQAQQAVTQDENALTAAQNSTAQSQQQTQLAVQQAQQNLQLAQAQYNDRTAAQQALNNAQNQVQQAQANLQSAQAALAQAKQPPDPASVQAAQASVLTAEAGVQSAQAQLQSAQLQESNTILKAPISGVVTQVNANPGELVSAQTPTVVLDDSVKSDLQVNIQVSQSQIGSVQAGQPVSLTVSAYPGVTFHGTVTQVYPTPQVVSNVTEYTVMATVTNTSGQLKSGMTANVVIQTAQKQHVLTVPAISLQQLGTAEGVYVYGSRPNYSNGKQAYPSTNKTSGSANHAFSLTGNAKLPAGVYFQPVQTGLFGTNDVEVTQGLHVGEKILLVLPGQASTSSPFGGGQAGGGFRGGGRIG